MMKKIINMLLASAAGMCLLSCSSDSKSGSTENTPVEVTTPQISNITATSATVTTSISGGAVFRKGICYATAAAPTIDDKEVKGTQQKDQTLALSGLTSNTTYYVRAYAMTDEETVYSEEVSFKTSNSSSSEDLASWVPPTWNNGSDDYRNISDWSKRSQWNLANVHDPTVFLADDGYYYMYQTDASYGNASMGSGKGHFHGRRSKDLINWEYLGGTMMETPSWVLETCNAYRAEMGLDPITDPQYLYWAPCARKVKEGLYRMYYAIGIDNYIKTGKPSTAANFDKSWTERAFIGVMETADPASNIWVDKGMVICSSSDRGTNYARSSVNGDYGSAYFCYNAIDPTYIITPDGEHWLAYGSWHSGFAIVQLDAETGKTLTPLGKPWASSYAEIVANGYGKRINTRVASGTWARWQGSEGPEIVYRNGYYYLFMAYDELDVPYHTRVARSQNVDGPYVAINGTNVTNGGSAFPILTHPYKFSNSYGWVGISHCAVFEDGKGNWFYASQQRFPSSYPGNASNAVMLGGVRQILWTSDNWPVVMPERYAAVPKATISAKDIAGTWEHIDLSYSKGNQKESSTMVFSEDGTITSGIWKNGTWTFDAETNTLKINGTIELRVMRECDWEATPRHHTLVYAGINGTKSYWGKKSY